MLSSILGVLDRNRTFLNLEPFGEPQLGSRGLYGALGGTAIPDAQLAMLWVLNLSDGSRTPARHRRTGWDDVRLDRGDGPGARGARPVGRRDLVPLISSR